MRQANYSIAEMTFAISFQYYYNIKFLSYKKKRQNLLRTLVLSATPITLLSWTHKITSFTLSCNYTERMDNHDGETDETSRQLRNNVK